MSSDTPAEDSVLRSRLPPMVSRTRPHVLGIDDGPFEKRQRAPVPIVGVMMEGADLVEAVAVTEFPVDGAGATAFLVDWIRGLRLHPTLQGIVLGGITIAGLGVVDIERLSASIEVPTLVVTRRDPANHRLHEAFEAAAGRNEGGEGFGGLGGGGGGRAHHPARRRGAGRDRTVRSDRRRLCTE